MLSNLHATAIPCEDNIFGVKAVDTQNSNPLHDFDLPSYDNPLYVHGVEPLSPPLDDSPAFIEHSFVLNSSSLIFDCEAEKGSCSDVSSVQAGPGAGLEAGSKVEEQSDHTPIILLSDELTEPSTEMTNSNPSPSSHFINPSHASEHLVDFVPTCDAGKSESYKHDGPVAKSDRHELDPIIGKVDVELMKPPDNWAKKKLIKTLYGLSFENNAYFMCGGEEYICIDYCNCDIMASQYEIDDLEEENSSKQIKTKSKVWEEMKKIKTVDGYKVQCMHCGKLMSALGGTSHLRRHLLTCPKQEHKFRQLMQAMNPKFKNLSRHTIKRDLMSSYKKEKEVVKSELSEVVGSISLTTDNWRSEHTMDEYICVTAHWIDANWKLHKKIIWFKDLMPHFDGISIADEVALCLREWGIDNKIFSITLDNASYNDVMVNSLKQRLSINRTLLCDGELFQVRCCSHILNLIVQAGLKVADETISKVRNGIKYLKKSVSRAKIFYDIAEKSYQLNTSKKLRLDVSVRWNLTFLMLDHAIYYKSVLEHWGRRDVAFKNFVLSEEEWEKVQILHRFLKVFYDVTCKCSGSKYPTSNLYFRGVWKVYSHLMNEMKGPPSLLSEMIGKMKEKFDKYWREYSLVLCCATVMGPRYKLRYFDYCYKNVYGTTNRLGVVSDTLNSLYDEYERQATSTPPMTSASCSASNYLYETNDDSSNQDYEDFLKSRSSQSEKT
ncbi:zinc finger BED domain-containing protein RICESLEEPER 2-like [Senna tora]|uniref:Zinc finger BED domain-containing protein RICESLEEPER 2-like n=1 Tax=Senna tora TaxID=362788 RepID=A0A834WPP3_9FABA|nr:zinc finger BED domain-containing protein RICESLEEPER 2-like [Senna tora]